MKIEVKRIDTGYGYGYGVFINGNYFHYGNTIHDAYSLIQMIKEGLIDTSIPFIQTEIAHRIIK
jgi:hypothetical protein